MFVGIFTKLQDCASDYGQNKNKINMIKSQPVVKQIQSYRVVRKLYRRRGERALFNDELALLKRVSSNAICGAPTAL